MSNCKQCAAAERDTIRLEIVVCGGSKKQRKKKLNKLLVRATKKIVKGKYPDQEGTTFEEQMGGGAGP